MKAVILGCGRVGARVASALDEEHSVTVLDWNQSSFDRLSPSFSGDTVFGNGIDADILRLAGADTADIFMALTASDNTNVTSAQVARVLGATRALARVYDAERSGIYDELGLITVSPTILGAQRLFDFVVGPAKDS